MIFTLHKTTLVFRTCRSSITHFVSDLGAKVFQYFIHFLLQDYHFVRKISLGKNYKEKVVHSGSENTRTNVSEKE